jgi:hypothetical protein
MLAAHPHRMHLLRHDEDPGEDWQPAKPSGCLPVMTSTSRPTATRPRAISAVWSCMPPIPCSGTTRVTMQTRTRKP